MKETMKGEKGAPVIQFSVFTENKLGRLYDLIRLLGTRNIHVVALTTLDTTDSSIIRLVVDDPEGTRRVLRNNTFAHSESELLVLEMDNETDLRNILRVLLEAEININYTYSFLCRPRQKPAIAMSLEEIEFAERALTARNFRILKQNDISR